MIQAKDVLSQKACGLKSVCRHRKSEYFCYCFYIFFEFILSLQVIIEEEKLTCIHGMKMQAEAVSCTLTPEGNMKNVSVLGSTGSIGTQTLDVIRHLKDIKPVALSAHKNIDLLEKQIREFRPAYAAVTDEASAAVLRNRVSGTDTVILSGEKSLSEIACLDEADIIVTAIVGNVGIKPTYEAALRGRTIALANKETLVSAGELITETCRKNNAALIPVDSEHSAIFQCLRGENNKIKRILLTASGGPFRNFSRSGLQNISAADALKHPTWKMGKKITVDSATLMNKGLEVIEAKWLFGTDTDRIDVLIHPQSIVHSAVEFEDNAVIAQLGTADMRQAIQYAFTHPERLPGLNAQLDLISIGSLTFEKPDTDTFPCLGLAYEALRTGGSMPAVMNAANETAVEAFLSGTIGFYDIPDIISRTMAAIDTVRGFDADMITEIDRAAASFSRSLLPVK